MALKDKLLNFLTTGSFSNPKSSKRRPSKRVPSVTTPHRRSFAPVKRSLRPGRRSFASFSGSRTPTPSSTSSRVRTTGPRVPGSPKDAQARRAERMEDLIRSLDKDM